MLFPESYRRSARLSLLVSSLAVIGAAAALTAQAPPQSTADERRERNERLDDIFRELGVRAGARVADVGAGSGFYTVRLSRAVGDSGRVYAVDVSPRALGQLRRRVDE